jgi:hypothetical protein
MRSRVRAVVRSRTYGGQTAGCNGGSANRLLSPTVTGPAGRGRSRSGGCRCLAGCGGNWCRRCKMSRSRNVTTGVAANGPATVQRPITSDCWPGGSRGAAERRSSTPVCAVGRNLPASIADGLADPRVAVTGAGASQALVAEESWGRGNPDPVAAGITGMHSPVACRTRQESGRSRGAGSAGSASRVRVIPAWSRSRPPPQLRIPDLSDGVAGDGASMSRPPSRSRSARV